MPDQAVEQRLRQTLPAQTRRRGTAELNSRVRKPRMTSVRMPHSRPFGMSFFGAWLSSAASGSCSIASRNQMANGSEAKDAGPAEGHERTAAIGQGDGRPIGSDADVEREPVEIEGGQRRQEEEHQDRHRQEGDEDRELEREFDAPDVEADEDDEDADPPHPLPFRRRSEDRLQVGADGDDDHAGRDDVFHILAEPGQEAAPRPHRGTSEGIGAAGVR